MRGARSRRACDIMASDHREIARGQSAVPRRERFRRITQLSQSSIQPNTQASAQASVREAIDAFARGEIVVVTDDDDRENEGDLIVAAAHTTPEEMAFIVRHTCGIVCAP